MKRRQRLDWPVQCWARLRFAMVMAPARSAALPSSVPQLKGCSRFSILLRKAAIEAAFAARVRKASAVQELQPRRASLLARVAVQRVQVLFPRERAQVWMLVHWSLHSEPFESEWDLAALRAAPAWIAAGQQHVMTAVARQREAQFLWVQALVFARPKARQRALVDFAPEAAWPRPS